MQDVSDPPADRHGSRGRHLHRAGTTLGWAVGCLMTLHTRAPAAPPHPPLPTPCVQGNCGSSASGFNTYGKAGTTIVGNTETITQTTADAIVNWADFNIANGYRVVFVQPSATAAILNNIWSADPSVIAGAMSANGQVYLLNQNGIVFANGAQINVGGLVASALPFALASGSTDPDALFKNGILSNNGKAVYSGTLPPVFQLAGTGCNGSPCAVEVQPGATLATTDGGRIMLLGQAVSNAGSITTPDGQAILGAGNAVYLAASTDPSLRGLLIEVNTGVLGGTVTNQGSISAPRGNVTLAGLLVNQQGQVTATTSVSANGSIFLVAGDASATNASGQPAPFYNNGGQGYGTLLPNNGGTLTLGPGSVTEVLPDTTGGATITEQNLANGNFIPSEVALAGRNVNLLGNALVRAPGATVLVDAAGDPLNQYQTPSTVFHDGGSIYVDSGATIDVSGLKDVPVPVTDNIIQVTLEGLDLQNDPLLRNGFLHGQQVTVNASQGSTLFNVAPYAGNIGLGISQVLTAAGSIQLNSDGYLVTRAGSTLNVSGGSVAYQGGYGPGTTNLIAANGQVYNISNAPNNLLYVGLANSYSSTDPTWGQQTSASPQTYYPGYLQGANAGLVQVTAPDIYLRGGLVGTTVAGPYQRTAATLPLGGEFQIGCGCIGPNGPDYHAPAVTLQDGATDVLGAGYDYTDPAASLPASLTAAGAATTVSPTQLTDGGFSRVSVYSNGAITLPAGSAVSLPAGGSFAAKSDASITIDGAISVAGSLATAPSGSTVSLTTTRSSPGDTGQHDVTLGPGASIDVVGAWVNDLPLLNPQSPTAPLAINGGSVSIGADGDVVLGAGSGIDVSGGGWINTAGKLGAGNAGTISIAATYLPLNGLVYAGTIDFGAGVGLAGNALVGGQGGSLALSAGSVTVGSVPQGTPGELLLAPDFFAGRGFANYGITGQSGVVIGGTSAQGAGVAIDPVESNLVFTQDAMLKPTGSSLEGFSQLAQLPQLQRSPASISFTATSSPVTGVPTDGENGNVLLGQNASITTDPGAKVTLAAANAGGSVTVLGSIYAPAGDITLQVENPAFVQNPNVGQGYFPGQQILLGPQAVLAAPAVADVNTLDAAGYVQGKVLPGGTVSLQAYKGYVVTDPGSTINVDGTAWQIDVANAAGVTPTLVAGAAGTIAIDAREGIVLQGNLQGEAARYNGAPVPGAAAGTLSIGLDLYDYGTTEAGLNNLQNPFPLTTRTLTLDSGQAYVPSNQLLSGTADVNVATIAGGGFGNVVLKSADVIAVNGAVTLATGESVVLDAPVLRGDSGASLRIDSPYVALGNYYNQSDYFDVPSNGGVVNPNAAGVLHPGCASAAACSATLRVDAQLIDVRGLSGWDGFASETLASAGDIRLTSAQNIFNTPPALGVPAGDGSPAGLRAGLDATGALTLQAQQAYPTTATDFTITAGTSVTIAPAAGSAGIPLSAGGILTINAPDIVQGGVLRAPVGEINLNAVDTTDPLTGATIPGSVTLTAGSVTSVAADGALIPYGSTVNGQQWTYSPNPTLTDIVGAPPAKAVNLQGANVAVSKGATVDLSGGGDLYAYEFVAGSGGSRDVLAPSSNVYTYAIVPSLGSQFAPVDAQFQQGSAATGRQTIYLSGVPGLAAGYYALLPAQYALLPGAFAIQVEKAGSGIAAGTSVAQPNGGYLVAGRFGVAGTDIVDSLTSTVLVVPDKAVRTQSGYTDSYANAFFTNAATAAGTDVPSVPADAGLLQIAASSSLALDGSVRMTAGSFTNGTDASGKPVTVQGSGGTVAIDAPNILIVDSAGTAPATNGALTLSAQSLDALGAQSLVIGATVQYNASGEVVTAGTTQGIVLDNTSVALSAPEVMLAALNSIALDPGAQVVARGAASAPAENLVLRGAGALLRASAAGPESLVVDTTVAQNPAGTLSVAAGALVQGTGSALLYSTGNTTAAEGATINAPALGLYSSRVSLGDVPTGAAAPGGLELTPQLLGQLQGLTGLTIGSSSTIDLYGPVSLGTPTSPNPQLANITLDAWAVDGYGSGAKVLQAGSITLQNSNTVAPAVLQASPVDGSGTLTLLAGGHGASAGQVTLGSGAKTVDGFSAVTVDATGAIVASGNGSLTVAGTGGAAVPLTLQAAMVTTTGATTQTIATAGPVSIQPVTGGKAVSAGSPGGSLAIQGGSIAQDGDIVLPGGIVTLQAQAGDVVLGAGSLTSAAGFAQSYSGTSAVAPAGTVTLAATSGNVVAASGATIDVTGATSADGKSSGAAGSLVVSAPQGQFQFAGANLQGGAAAGEAQGNFTLDAGSGLGGGGLAALTDALGGAGFGGAVSIRSRTDSAVSVTNSIDAASFQLAADAGTISVTGSINTSGGKTPGSDGGAIELWGGTGVDIGSGAQLLANAGAAGPVGQNGVAAPAHGGNITLGAATGTIVIDGGTPQNPTVFSLQGGGGAGTDGTLTLRAPRTADDAGVQVQVNAPAAVTVNTRQPVIVEGVRVYAANDLGSADAGCGSGGSCDVADTGGLLYGDAMTFVGNSAAIVAGLGFSGNSVEVRPGIEIRSGGDLVLDNTTSAWDLASWNAALGAPVNVTLRAAGNLIFNASLSDGFTNNGQSVAAWSFGESASTVDSGSYRLAAGADLTAANPLAIVAQAAPAAAGAVPNSGNLILTPGNLIRTGDGSIAIAAGGDVLLGYGYGYDGGGNLQVTASNPLSSVIYTAGVPAPVPDPSLFVAPTGTSRVPVSPSYATDGGNLGVSAAVDILSAPSAQLVSDWLYRQGAVNSVTGQLLAPNKNTSWYLLFGNFQQGIGALGGGDLSVSAGRDIVNLSAVVPTTGQLLGLPQTVPSAANVLVYGAGNLVVRAGGNIASGVYEDDWGNASLIAGGGLTAATTLGAEIPAVSQSSISTPLDTPLFPVLLAGSGTFDVAARTGITVNSIGNSTIVPVTVANTALTRIGAYYFTFDPNSTLNVLSDAGDVVLQNDSAVLPITQLNNSNSQLPNLYANGTFGNYYPPIVNVAALGGSIENLGTGIDLFPSATGNLRLLAQNSVTGASADNPTGQMFIGMNETDPALWASPVAPASLAAAPVTTALPATPLYQAATQPVYIVAETGNITAGEVLLTKAADLVAGNDITDVNFSGKNLNPGDVTLISAGGDITFSTPTAPLTNLLLQNTNGIQLAGPGALEVLAGRSINLGDSAGIITTGALTDARLPASGATLVAGAGFGQASGGGLRQPAIPSFTTTYLAPGANGAASAYAADLVQYMAQLYPATDANLSYADALTAFRALTPAQQLPFVAQVLSDELSATGLAHTLSGASYARGFTAIDTLFPQKDAGGSALTYQGDINLFFSQLKTESGGDINLLDPGGSVVVGVPNPPAALTQIKTLQNPTVAAAANLGILVLGQGAINGFASQSFDVNQSRILTLEGGNIILWASYGNIDAGAGAKSASGAPPPVIQTNAAGDVFVNPINDVSGSGIGQLLTGSGETAGLVNLIAPNGDVNAGDAGIRVAGNLNIAAVQVIGAGNITVVGTSTGVPTSEAGAFAGALSGANSLGDAGKSAVDQLSQDISGNNYQQLTESLAPTFIVVKMFCLGIECETQ